jgi:DNA polymerase-1
MIRTAFVPEPGWTFLSADYSQMELRLLAHLADDRGLIEVFEQGLDVHRATAALVAGVPLDEVTPQLRAAAKAVNFGIVYGMSEYRLSRDQGMTVEQARAFIAAYFERYPRIRTYIADTERRVQETGEVRTLYGRVRRFPDLVAGSGASRLTRPMRDTLLRQAVNATVQGTGADIVKRAMVVLDARLRAGGFRSRLLLQVHDELLLEAPPEELANLGALVREVMENAVQLSVPLKVDARTADSWAEAH